MLWARAAPTRRTCSRSTLQFLPATSLLSAPRARRLSSARPARMASPGSRAPDTRDNEARKRLHACAPRARNRRGRRSGWSQVLAARMRVLTRSASGCQQRVEFLRDLGRCDWTELLERNHALLIED